MTRLYILLIGMTFIGSVASIFLKKASMSYGIKALVTNPNLYIGGLLYVSSAVMNIYLLRYLDYSVVLPLTSLTYIWTMLLSRVIFGEKITARKAIGVALILVGAITISI